MQLASSSAGLQVLYLLPVAEVLDKEPTVTALWIVALLMGVIGYFIVRWRRGLLFLILALEAFLITAHLSELHDPWVGSAIQLEAGEAYFAHSYAAALVALLLPIAGWAVSRRLHKQRE